MNRETLAKYKRPILLCSLALTAAVFVYIALPSYKGMHVRHFGGTKTSRVSIVGYTSRPLQAHDPFFQRLQDRLIISVATLPEYEKMVFDFQLADEHAWHNRPCITAELRVSPLHMDLGHYIISEGSTESTAELMAKAMSGQIQRTLALRRTHEPTR